MDGKERIIENKLNSFQAQQTLIKIN